MLQAASASADGLKAPSSLAVGAAVPSTKQAVFSQADAQSPPSSKAGRHESPSAPAAAAAAGAGKPAPRAAVPKPAKPAVERKYLDGLDEAVAVGVQALCQVGCLKPTFVPSVCL